MLHYRAESSCAVEEEAVQACLNWNKTQTLLQEEVKTRLTVPLPAQ